MIFSCDNRCCFLLRGVTGWQAVPVFCTSKHKVRGGTVSVVYRNQIPAYGTVPVPAYRYRYRYTAIPKTIDAMLQIWGKKKPCRKTISREYRTDTLPTNNYVRNYGHDTDIIRAETKKKMKKETVTGIVRKLSRLQNEEKNCCKLIRNAAIYRWHLDYGNVRTIPATQTHRKITLDYRYQYQYQ